MIDPMKLHTRVPRHQFPGQRGLLTDNGTVEEVSLSGDGWQLDMIYQDGVFLINVANGCTKISIEDTQRNVILTVD